VLADANIGRKLSMSAQHLAGGMIADAAELQLAAERRLGEMLVKAKAAGQVVEGRRWSKNNSPAAGELSRVTLKDAGTVKAGQGGQGTFGRVSLAKDRAKHSRICSALLGDPISFRPWLC
jgi:hypothetical protein